LRPPLRFVSDVPGIERVRFVTSHPRYMSEGVIAAVAQCPKLMPVFHIPAQSGDDEVLRRMGRGYTAQRYLEIVRKIRERIPGMRCESRVSVAARERVPLPLPYYPRLIPSHLLNTV
jgi:tRNA-2-methylthio-N6-dimethylallyladenosine synthase